MSSQLTSQLPEIRLSNLKILSLIEPLDFLGNNATNDKSPLTGICMAISICLDVKLIIQMLVIWLKFFNWLGWESLINTRNRER